MSELREIFDKADEAPLYQGRYVIEMEWRDFELRTVGARLSLDIIERCQRNMRRAFHTRNRRRLSYWTRQLERWTWGVEIGDTSRHIIIQNWEPDAECRWVIAWDAGYDVFYWTGDCEAAWGRIQPEDGDPLKAIVYESLDLAESDIQLARLSRPNAQIVCLPNIERREPRTSHD